MVSCARAWLRVCVCEGNRMGFKEDVAFEHLSDFMCFYVQFVTSWSFLNIPIILCLKYFRTPGPLFFPISYSNLIRSELHDFGPIVFAKFPGQSKGTLCCLEEVTEFQTEQNEKWLSLWPHIIELVLWWELSDQFITVSNWFQAQSHFSSDFWDGLSEDRECGWYVCVCVRQ